MAQKVFYLNNFIQPSPMYFLILRKCVILGVCTESILRQVNYMVDEAVDMGKGTNAIVSMLYNFFAHYGLGEKNVLLHADNCVGQNMNSIMIQCLIYRLITNKLDSIILSFMISGHTKFSHNLCFGLL